MCSEIRYLKRTTCISKMHPASKGSLEPTCWMFHENVTQENDNVLLSGTLLTCGDQVMNTTFKMQRFLKSIDYCHINRFSFFFFLKKVLVHYITPLIPQSKRLTLECWLCISSLCRLNRLSTNIKSELWHVTQTSTWTTPKQVCGQSRPVLFLKKINKWKSNLSLW